MNCAHILLYFHCPLNQLDQRCKPFHLCYNSTKTLLYQQSRSELSLWLKPFDWIRCKASVTKSGDPSSPTRSWAHSFALSAARIPALSRRGSMPGFYSFAWLKRFRKIWLSVRAQQWRNSFSSLSIMNQDVKRCCLGGLFASGDNFENMEENLFT